MTDKEPQTQDCERQEMIEQDLQQGHCDKTKAHGARCALLRCEEDYASSQWELLGAIQPDFSLLGAADGARASTRLLFSPGSALLFEIMYAESEAAPAHIREKAIAKRLQYSPHLNAAYLGFCYGQWDNSDCEVMKAAKAWDDEMKRRAGERPHQKKHKFQKADHTAMQVEDADLRHAERWVRAAHAYHLIGYHPPVKSAKPIYATQLLVDFLERVGDDVFDRQRQFVLDAVEIEADRGDAS